VVLEEREYKNTFSKPLINGLMNTFEAIQQMADIKVVVVYGYDNYFCCGGTKEELIGILEEKLQFTDLNFYDLLLQSEVPVISAMQGHALGGGLVFGCYADIIVMGEECLYSANFMKYGNSAKLSSNRLLVIDFRSASLLFCWGLIFQSPLGDLSF
jgi:polyketide biosynthesis enoyl-CoA hydratase PksI